MKKQLTGIWEFYSGKRGNQDAIQINFDTLEIIVTVPHANFYISVVGKKVFMGGTEFNALELANHFKQNQVPKSAVNKWY